MNTLLRTYRVNWDEETDSYIEDANGSMPVKEFETDGITQRIITVANNNDLKKQIFKTVLEHQTFIDGKWFTTQAKDTRKPVASLKSYINIATGVPVPKAEAVERVDDLDREVLNYSDPENPTSYEPPRYEQKDAVKAGYAVEATAIIGQFAPTLFPFYEDVMTRHYEIQE